MASRSWTFCCRSDQPVLPCAGCWRTGHHITNWRPLPLPTKERSPAAGFAPHGPGMPRPRRGQWHAGVFGCQSCAPPSVPALGNKGCRHHQMPANMIGRVLGRGGRRLGGHAAQARREITVDVDQNLQPFRGGRDHDADRVVEHEQPQAGDIAFDRLRKRIVRFGHCCHQNGPELAVVRERLGQFTLAGVPIIDDALQLGRCLYQNMSFKIPTRQRLLGYFAVCLCRVVHDPTVSVRRRRGPSRPSKPCRTPRLKSGY